MHDWVPIGVAALRRGRSTATLYRWVAGGRIRGKLRDGVLHVSEAEVMAVPAPRRGRPSKGGGA